MKEFDYSSNNAYFITIYVENMRNILGDFVGSDDLGAPQMRLFHFGKIIKEHIEEIEDYYDVILDQYVIMPNHIHLLIIVNGGVPRSSRPTMLIPNIIAALKKSTNRKMGYNIWQTSYHDHIIRDSEDYSEHLKYIEENPIPIRWTCDKYYGGIDSADKSI